MDERKAVLHKSCIDLQISIRTYLFKCLFIFFYFLFYFLDINCSFLYYTDVWMSVRSGMSGLSRPLYAPPYKTQAELHHGSDCKCNGKFIIPDLTVILRALHVQRNVSKKGFSHSIIMGIDFL